MKSEAQQKLMTIKQETVKALQRSRNRISKPENWCRKAMALDMNGAAVNTNSRKAVAWCAYGSVCMEAKPFSLARHYCLAWLRQGVGLNYQGLTSFNDVATHAQVIELFDRTIEAQS